LLKKYISKGENLTVEFKESKTQLNKDAYETVCAFSNRAGGDIFLGINDNGKIIGVDEESIESIKKDFVTTMNNTEDKIFPYATMEDFDLELIKRIRIVASNRRVDTHPWEGLSDFELLKSSGLYKVDKTTNKEGFTLGAILLFGKDEAIVNALPHHKTDLILRKINLDRYDDREIITTNLIDSYYKMMEFAKKHLNDPFYLEGDIRISLRDKIFREIVANSLVHREYSSAYVAKMIIEKGRVIFENANIPHSYGELNPSNFTPYPKNPSIAKVFREIGFADELGSGVKNLYKYSKTYGGSNPIVVEGEVFKIEIKTIEQNINEGINSLYVYIKNNPNQRVSQIEKILNVPTKTLERWIKQLKDEEKIIYKGSKKTGGYFVN